ncbi:MAG: hypothetical protein ACRD0D_04160 [Acidimicrobiales bacterium]
MRRLRFLLRFIGVAQGALGVLFVLAPTSAATLFDLHPSEPGWVDWLFVTMGARYLGYAYGMFVAAADPLRNRSWIDSMIVIQALDWVGTLVFLATGDVSLRNVTSAAFLPVIFVAGLLWWHPRRWASARPSHGATEG